MINHLRLGDKKRKRSEYSLHQRDAGTSYLDRMELKCATKVLSVLMLQQLMEDEEDQDDEEASDDEDDIVGEDDDDDDDSDSELVLFSGLLVGKIVEHERPALRIPDAIPPKIVYSPLLPDSMMREYTGFSHMEFSLMFRVWAVPEVFRVGGVGPSSFRFDGRTALYFFLCRYRAVTDKLRVAQEIFGRDYTVCSKVFLTVLLHMDNRYRHLYSNLAAAVPKFSTFNAKICAKIQEKYGEIPPEAHRTALFCDGTRVSIGRCTNYADQRRCYNKKYGHNSGTYGH
jgi:hypothetical protein